MAHKSKTQRAKAAAAKQNRKDRQEREALAGVTDDAAQGAAGGEKGAKLTRAEKKEAREKLKREEASKKESKPKKVRFQFLHDVRAEMKRVTWPSRTDVLRWSGVVVGALLFFGIYVAVLDNLIITPGLWALSNLGA